MEPYSPLFKAGKNKAEIQADISVSPPSIHQITLANGAIYKGSICKQTQKF